jgi:hypothetical protein
MNGFELTVSIPAEPRFAHAVEALAAHAAYQAGCNRELADEFGTAVDAAVQGCLTNPGKDIAIDVVFRHVGAEIEAVLTCGERVRIARQVPIDV